MLYPVYVHIGDKSHAHGVTIPDFPGCFTAADSWEDLPRVVQEAAEQYFETEKREIPAPTPLEKLAQDPAYQGGVWMLMEVDVTKLRQVSEVTQAPPLQPLEAPKQLPQTAPEAKIPAQADEAGDEAHPKIEIMLPEDLLKIVDEYAASHHLTRSAVLARAAVNLMTKAGS